MEIQKILLLYLCMAIAVSAFYPEVVLGNDKQNSIMGIFNVAVNSTTGEIYINETGFSDPNLNDEVFNDETESGFFKRGLEGASQFFQNFVDGLQNVLGVVKILFKFLFSPFIFVFSPELMGGAPFFIKIIFALPLVFMALMAIIRFIRGI